MASSHWIFFSRFNHKHSTVNSITKVAKKSYRSQR